MPKKTVHKLTKKGYLRYRTDGKRLRMEHQLVWEEHFGKIPAGMQIHHKDFDKTNNDVSNLQLVTPLEHKRLHEGCYIQDGVWYKPCVKCGEYKPIDESNWYFNKKTGWITTAYCRPCYVKKVVEERRIRVANGWKRKGCSKKASKCNSVVSVPQQQTLF